MLIAKIENNKVVSVIDYREAFGNHIPSNEELAQHSYKQINLFRNHNRLTEKLVACAPTVEGDWVYTVEIKQMTEEEIQAAKDSAMAQIRGTRNRLLAESDYTQIPDNPSPKKTEWATYRQQLRDLTATITGDPREFKDWPKNPDWKPIGF